MYGEWAMAAGLLVWRKKNFRSAFLETGAADGSYAIWLLADVTCTLGPEDVRIPVALRL